MLAPVTLDAIRQARSHIASYAMRSPLIRLPGWEGPGVIYLKLENLQPMGSYKIRGAAHALLQLDPAQREQGVWTASAGNMALALAWCARGMSIPCTVIVPHDAPRVKLDAIQSQAARIIQVPFPQYQEIQRAGSYTGAAGTLIHPFADERVMAGNGTIALEILEDLPDADAFLVPYGGGGLSCGIAACVRAVKAGVKVYACEVETAAPLAASLAGGHPTTVSYIPSFISGMGAPFVFPQMWSLASQLLDGSLVVSLAQAAQAIRLLAERVHVVAEGAGGVSLAAALAGVAGRGKIVCLVSGGNIDMGIFTKILSGLMP